ncbi:Uncharacterised protein [Mycobacteroides abscessus subsp. abscessus]|nr:Uncharacterised protein [Mycobacteroides abscessus subsp. abscessus]
MPATTPYLRPSGSLRANTSNTHCRCAIGCRSAAETMVSSYWSVSRAVLRMVTIPYPSLYGA